MGRARTRLRPGKLLSLEGAFIADCAILDRSPDGVRVRLYGSGDPIAGDAVRLFDEADAMVRVARLAWRCDRDAGLRLSGERLALDANARCRIAGRYYAVAN